MDFDFSEQQIMLRATAKDFVSREFPKTRIKELYADDKGYDSKAWKAMAGLGWQGLILPPEYEGTGAEFLDLVIVIEEMGRNIVPGPFFATVAMCSLPLLEFGTEEQKSKYLPPIANGDAIWTLALIEESGSYSPGEISMSAAADIGGYVLEGKKILVPDAHIAGHMLVVARTGSAKEEISVFIVDAGARGLKVERIPTMAGDRQCVVSFDKVSVAKSDILGQEGGGCQIVDYMLQRVALLKTAEMFGASQAVLDMTVAYAKERIQFDRPIGSFQAVQTKLVEMSVAIDAVGFLLYQAAWEMSMGLPSQLHISQAKAKAFETYQRTCYECMTLHGSIGVTQDCDLGYYYRRVREAEFTGGNNDLHVEKIVAALGL